MSDWEAGDYIEDILNAMLDIEEFTAEYSYDRFINDRKTQYAVIRAIEIIGEASKNVPAKIREKYQHIPWRDMATMRDRLIHGYFGVDPIIVWDTIKQDIPPLIPMFRSILAEME
ncbi:HepT-like ribonuclease domain-containing protein [Methanosarcina sp. Mfa9]|uniref:HepT-like ribonuclease domain-containing protein n=1 Tax=Methanosarcina sp. Mfa9 TaxID=3439063 RepID=UPI003F842CA0